MLQPWEASVWHLTGGEKLDAAQSDLRKTGMGKIEPDKDLEQLDKITNHFFVNAANQILSLGPRTCFLFSKQVKKGTTQTECAFSKMGAKYESLHCQEEESFPFISREITFLARGVTQATLAYNSKKFKNQVFSLAVVCPLSDPLPP